VSQEDIDPSDVQELRNAVPEIVDAVQRLLDRVRAGELAQPDASGAAASRVSWL
jgi:hypothetical protein